MPTQPDQTATAAGIARTSSGQDRTIPVRGSALVRTGAAADGLRPAGQAKPAGSSVREMLTVPRFRYPPAAGQEVSSCPYMAALACRCPLRRRPGRQR